MAGSFLIEKDGAWPADAQDLACRHVEQMMVLRRDRLGAELASFLRVLRGRLHVSPQHRARLSLSSRYRHVSSSRPAARS
ncbi:hypothetical protein NITHO_1320002 [Nitrolancea hollandica Lb]|uniref:Uncharacterized protein n=1 Tax=Nitrolancea hollandica Lb TaxID=1129897 RepID=I4ED22_9BACT|nr:hypothetical protein NITHO_1320002 [Nitrolancea hollandica Lb]